ncbi:NADH-quinone oxidoreductase subunit A [Enterobacteriaceae endosymbiont of Macroplea mutica]|uniref:NADH-quinone oxidoreductase subunit A n=1 Tax=Enterobacteriaceae endosymbiont of Macroplea mutica TaxID=2675791 RepID=UPI001449F6E4|nr:NADH-quinone oxidoreductase subunit A [Enterobacteriaceae endosymbiont of Macroplea mutica]QJC31383.1 NADH-quinone oxidoreductase subunit A [Enterobacteriaceae endosymbiont of Macroplea mutica]
MIKLNNLVLFTSFAIFISSFMLFISYYLGGRSYGIDKNIPFESGAASYQDTHIKMTINFFLIAIFFVIFDIESLYLYTWAISIKMIRIEGLITGLLFIITILLSLLYLFKMNIFNFYKHLKSN